MTNESLTALIAELLAEPVPGPLDRLSMAERVERTLDRFACRQPPDSLDSEADKQRWIMRYCLKMLQVSHLRLLEPAPAPPAEVLERFQSVVEYYPLARAQFAQGSVDAVSSVRRAVSVHERLGGQGAVLFLGDDDATSVALAMLGDYEVHAIDIDERIVGWVERAARKAGLVVRGGVHDLRHLPENYAGRFSAVVTDPSADLELAREFLKAARRCLIPGQPLFWCDHPDWNLAYDGLLAICRELGLELEVVCENWHSYQASVKDDSTARFFGLPPDWFHRLAGEIRIWSHLLVMRSPAS